MTNLFMLKSTQETIETQLYMIFPFCVMFQKTELLGGCQSGIHF